MFCYPFLFCNHLDREERAGCFTLFICLMHSDCQCSVTLSNGAIGLVCSVCYHTHLLFILFGKLIVGLHLTTSDHLVDTLGVIGGQNLGYIKIVVLTMYYVL